MSRSGADLALLLLGGFRQLVDAAREELAVRGYDARPVDDFAMRAIAAGATSASDLARQLSITRQSAAKTITQLQERGYVAIEADPQDGRRKRLQVTERGQAMLSEGEAVFEELRDRWAQRIGADELDRLQANLTGLIGSSPIRLDSPGWMSQGLGEAL